MNRFRRIVFAGALILGAAGVRPVSAYSVLAHESNIDALWDRQIVPLLRHRFPHATPDDLTGAKAYAYGGSVIQDLGYYPFGSHLFTNLLHYVKTGEFVEALLNDASDVNEYAFAIGALCHYASDTEGHAIAVNHAIPLMYPKVKRKFGSDVPYDEAPKEHILVEFAFDVLLVANGGYKLQAYHDFIGFKVAKPLLERAFLETYGVEMKDLFLSEDLAIGTFRRAVASTIPHVTRVAWNKKREQIAKVTPGAIEREFVYVLPRHAYEREFGAQYRKPGFFTRLVGWLFGLLPKIGPLRPLAFKVPTPEAEQLFIESIERTRQRFGQELGALRAGHLDLPNVDFDTAKPSRPGEYRLADQTRFELAKKLRDK
jgi:Zinc dependent phospholipase C